MRKTIFVLLSLIIIILSIATIFLSTKGYETNKFNDFISDEVKKADSNLDIQLNTIKIKIDIKKLDLFLSTTKPKIVYQSINLPISQLKIYVDFFSLIKSEVYIKRTAIFFNEMGISDIQKLIVGVKPSNIKSFILNNTSGGTINGYLDLYFLKDLKLNSYKASGNIKKTNINFVNKIDMNKLYLNFIVDPNLILFNSISFDFKNIPISNGTISVDRQEGFLVEGSLNTNIDSDSERLSEFISLFPALNVSNNKINISGNFLNKFILDLDNSLKVKNYNYNLTGKIKKTTILLGSNFKNLFLKNEIKKITLKDSSLKINFDKNKKNNMSLEGVYRLNNNKEYLKYKLDNNFNKSISKINLNLDANEDFFIKLINYEKEKNKIANISSEIHLSDKKIKINNFKFKEGRNLIFLQGLEMNKDYQLNKFQKIEVNTFRNSKENNNFEVLFGSKILIKGKRYDSTNLIKNIKSDNKNKFLNKINKEIQINFKNLSTDLSIPLKNFNLLGKLEKGKFVKILSKSEFSDTQFLDITLKKIPNSNKKTLEIYSGIAKPLLIDFDFFKGLEGGQLLFTSIYNDNISTSNLQIKNFKVLDTPAFAKLLALADFRGLEVLLSGEGLNFESLEIKFRDEKKVRTISEIYAVGPSLTILMEGYIEKKESGLTSLRGTMVPAKEINKLISKIPVLGDILIGKEIGEGVFGVSFKMKGPPGKIKTVVNPIKTLTPRFITRALEKRKKESKDN
tara:strand:+ start:612 stop:2825 length:2214 start_codon:yes stop_codon:yes gene_type:complete